MKPFTLGNVAGLTLTVKLAAIQGTLGIWIVLSIIGIAVLNLPAGFALVGGLAGAGLHWLWEICHQFGHAWAARQVGYPMTGVKLGTFYVLSTSVYPQDEGNLPADLHIRRALGGPAASLLLTILTGLLVPVLQPAGGVIAGLAWFSFLENLLVFSIGSLLPLGFNDGSTLLYWRGRL